MKTDKPTNQPYTNRKRPRKQKKRHCIWQCRQQHTIAQKEYQGVHDKKGGGGEPRIVTAPVDGGVFLAANVQDCGEDADDEARDWEVDEGEEEGDERVILIAADHRFTKKGVSKSAVKV